MSHLATIGTENIGSYKKRSLKLSHLGSGLVFGDDDCIAGRGFSSSLKCLSQTGSLIVMKAEEYLKCFKQQSDAWKTQFDIAKSKESAQNLQLTNFRKVKRQEELTGDGEIIQESGRRLSKENARLNDLFFAVHE